MSKAESYPSGARAGRPKRKNDPEGTRRDILEIARQEFTRNGLSGARIDVIAERTRTSKHMIYYYFGSKEGLYQAVLEAAYAGIREREGKLDLEGLAPREALRRLIEVTFDYDQTHPDFVSLVSMENLHHAEYLQSAPIRETNSVIIRRLEEILARGVRQGLFRSDLDAVDVHMAISSLCFFRVANRHTFKALFNRDLLSPRVRAHHRRMIADAILGMLAR
ncbi:MAG TPA: TetR family transcriptional regulator [Steroidobacteraceae bacterium]|nr:TetR family transcriptional regulator [Steroidobacteraceae bacterium]